MFDELNWIGDKSHTAVTLLWELHGRSELKDSKGVLDDCFLSTDATLFVDITKTPNAQFLFDKNHVDLLLKASEEIKACEVEWEKWMEEQGRRQYMKPFPKNSICSSLFQNIK